MTTLRTLLALSLELMRVKPDPEITRQLDDSDANYRDALARLRAATAEVRKTTSSSLDALDRRVLDSDELMRDALGERKTNPDG